MKVIFMGRKPFASWALRHLVEKGVEVAAVVAFPKEKEVHWSERLIDTAQELGLITTTPDDLYNAISSGKKLECGVDLSNIDLVISALFWGKIKKPLITLPKIGCIICHPGLLPNYRGVGGYNFAIYEELDHWGASMIFAEDDFDIGDVIKAKTFEINPKEETAFTLEQKTQKVMLELFKEVIADAMQNGILPKKKQGKGRYITQKDFEKLRKIRANDSIEEIEKKIRAFWYPPYKGAFIEVNGQEFSLVSDGILKEISKKYYSSESSNK